MTMALATEPQEFGCGPAPATEVDREIGVAIPAAGRRDVGSARTVTSLAGHVGNHHLLVDSRSPFGGNLRGVTAKTGTGGRGGWDAPSAVKPGGGGLMLCPGVRPAR